MRDLAGMTAAWTIMGVVFAAVAMATVAVGVAYALAAGAVGVREAKTVRDNAKSRG